MMKRFRLLLTFFLLTTLTVLSAQQENDPCSAPCLGPSGTQSGVNPAADGSSPNNQLPCGGGTSEDNPTWYTFVAGCTNFNLSVSVSGCSSGTSIQVTLFEGDDCGSIGAAGCVNCVTGGSVSLATIPGKQYWIQVDGCAEAICNFSLIYDPNCILKDIPKPIITGPLTACKGTTQDYSAVIPGGIVPAGYTWSIVPASAGQIIVQGDLTTQIKWNQTGTFQLCATPKFNVKCPVTGIQKGCITVVVTELKEAICSKTICAEEAPFDYDLMPCIQSANPNVMGSPDPDVFVILGPPGTTKTTTINYTMDPSGCSGKVKLTATVKAKGTKVLPPMLICEDDSVKVGSSWLKCANASPGIQNYTVEYNSNKPTVCDTTYNFILQCLKINPIVTPANPSLDCINTSVTLKAGNSVFLPVSSAANPGVKSYLWSTGATTPDILVTTKGVYCVTISYEYTLTTAAGTISKKCSKVKCITVTGSGTTPEAPVPIELNPYPCLNDTATYALSVNAGTTYDWTITGGTPATFTGNSIKVQWGNTPPYKVCAVAKNVCGSSLPGCIDIKLNEGPKLPVITGPTPICAGDTMTTYSTPKLTTPNPTYTWTLPAGASFVGKTDSNVINVKWANNATSGPITLVVGDKCGKSPVATLNIIINQLPAAPTAIDGKLNTCKNETTDYTVNPLVPFAMDYNWTVKGGTITSSTAGPDTKTISVNWTTVSDNNEVCVSAVNNCDTIGKKFCIKVSTKDFPKPTAGSNKSVCGLKTKLNGNIPVLNSGNTGKWTQITGPGTSTFDNDTEPKAEVTVTECGEYQFVWAETNSAGCSGKDTVMVTFSEEPTITNPVVTCDPVAKTFNATFNVIGCIAPYVVTMNNITGSTPQTLTTAPYTFTTPDIPQTTKFVIYAIQSGSCTSTFIDSVDCNCVTKAGEMDLQATQTACSLGGDVVKAIHKTGTETTDLDDVTAFVLYEGTATTITKAIVLNKTGEFTFNAATMECGKTYYIGFLVGNNNGTGFPSATDQCLKLTPVNQEVKWDCVPKPNAGVNDEVCGLSYVLKAATPAAGITGVWSSSNGATFTPSNSPTATVTIPDPAGTYKFFWTETNGKCKDSASVNITFKDSDITTTPEKYTCDAQNENYTVKFDVSGGKAPYFVLDCTTNAIIATLSNAPYTFNSASIKSGDSYCVKIADSNGCDTITLNKSYACGCATQLGSFTLDTDVCVGTDLKAVRANNDVLDGNDTWEFVLADISNPKDPSINIFARNQTGVFSFDPATLQCDKTYKLIYVVGNKNGAGTGVKFDDPCLSASSKDVKFICIPSTVSSVVKVDTCAKQVTLSSDGKNGTWTVTPNAGITFVAANNPATIANGVTWGTYTFTWTEDNNGCKASSDAPLSLVSPSNLTYKNNVVCESTNKKYTLSVDLTGAAPFSIDQISTNATGNLVGNVFTSDPIESGKQVTLSFKDALSCIPTTYNFDHTCPCTSKAGTMDPAQLKLCEGTDAEASKPPLSGIVLDGDDTFEFVLHESATSTLGSIKGRNKTGKFKFDAATMEYGKLYYISHIVGDDKAGQVDLNYFCKDIAKGTPVVWNKNPTLVVSKDETICKGASAEIKLTMTGQADFEIFYKGNTPLLSKNNTTILPVNPTETTIYEFTKVTDSNGCFTDVNNKVTITVNEPAKSGFPSPDRRLCFGQDQTIDLNTEVTGGDAGGTWSVSPATNFTPSTGIFKTKSSAPGTYTFTYTVKGKAPCPDASTSVKITIDAIPNADAGIDKELNCDNTEITLGGNSTSGSSITYTWTSIDGTPLSNTAVKNPTVKAAGRFVLQVRDSLSSCFAYDTCLVKKDINKIDSAAYKVIQPNCFGEDNGSFLVSNVYGGTPPYQFSINNGPFTPYKNFSNLKAGSYFVKMKDSKGCPLQDSILVDQPYEIDVELGATYPPDNNNDEKDFLNLGEAADLDAVINFPTTDLKKLIWYPQCDSCKTLNLIVKPQETTLYAVTVINNKGCIAKDNVLVQVKKPRNVFIPNIFHPDSDLDGNRKLRVYLGLDVAKVHYFRVYDRWGDVIYEDLDFTRDQVYQQDKGWDGSFRKERAQPGVYSFSCKVEFVDGYIEIYKGDVLMILKD